MRNEIQKAKEIMQKAAANANSKYGNDQLQHFAENFDSVFGDRIGIIGE